MAKKEALKRVAISSKGRLTESEKAFHLLFYFSKLFRLELRIILGVSIRPSRRRPFNFLAF